MLIIVSYDVATETATGRRRLRRVAKLCEASGQRVQKSVFECRLNAMQFEELERNLLDAIDPQADNLRIYRIVEPTEIHVREYGCFRAINFEDPLIL